MIKGSLLREKILIEKLEMIINMHRNDKSKYLLYIEPKKEEKLKEPINDELTELMEMALSKATAGTSRYSHLDDMGDGWEPPENSGLFRLFKGKKIPSFGSSAAWMGMHRTDCGEMSTCRDYQLENGMITNSLAPFYLRWYRYSIPENDMLKIKELADFYEKSL